MSPAETTITVDAALAANRAREAELWRDRAAVEGSLADVRRDLARAVVEAAPAEVSRLQADLARLGVEWEGLAAALQLLDHEVGALNQRRKELAAVESHAAFEAANKAEIEARERAYRCIVESVAPMLRQTILRWRWRCRPLVAR